ncbi:type I restriction-modification system subunit M N-terminal domain-containing protein [Acinetobacter baumannii]|uniref:type I restriction-modification system subunit M N-terminal domain-containing protein n=1 Tax=Acinetobacter baumannii TaxID=470 RepID=UPI00223BEC86|nr:type I restriction-modification system subunit M N-terminal domain-containing protein [Acinetobacter baumannii]
MANENAKLEDLLWGAAEFLRGQIDASDYKQYVFPLLFFKRLSDVYDDELEDAKKKWIQMTYSVSYNFIVLKYQVKQAGK